MKRFVLISATAVLLSGCLGPDAQDRIAATKFRVNPDKTFTFTGDAVVEQGQTLETTQPLKESWLKDWLGANNLCPNGYQIIDRRGARTGATTLMGGAWYTVDFTGRCL